MEAAARVDAVEVVLGVTRLVLYFNEGDIMGPFGLGNPACLNLHGPLVGVGDVAALASTLGEISGLGFNESLQEMRENILSRPVRLWGRAESTNRMLRGND